MDSRKDRKATQRQGELNKGGRTFLPATPGGGSALYWPWWTFLPAWQAGKSALRSNLAIFARFNHYFSHPCSSVKSVVNPLLQVFDFSIKITIKIKITMIYFVPLGGSNFHSAFLPLSVLSVPSVVNLK